MSLLSLRNLSRSLIILALAAPVWAQNPAFDAEAQNGGGTELTWTHTPVGTPDCAYVAVLEAFNGTDTIGSASYGTDSMTRILFVGLTVGEPAGLYIYGLNNVTDDGGAVTVTLTEQQSENRRAASYTLTSSTDACLVEGTNSETGVTEDPALTVSTGAGVETWGLCAIVSGHNQLSLITVDAAFTEHVSNDPGAEVRKTSRITSNDAGGGWTHTWDGDGMQPDEDYVVACIAVKEDGGGGGGGPPVGGKTLAGAGL